MTFVLGGSIAIRYHSWLKEGFGAAASQKADDAGLPASGAATLPVRLKMAGHTQAIEHDFALASPGDISTLDSAAIGRCMPKANSRECEPNFFPYVEFTDAALPWQYTPAVASDNGRLIPWLTLAVLEEDEDISLASSGTCPNFRLSISAKAGQRLPKLQEAYAWTHIEERDPAANPAAAIKSDPERFTARMMSPKKMKPNRPYLACLVPVFEAGRLAGLAREGGDVGAQLAWDDATDTLDLPVYHHWRFRSGNRDFEALTRALSAYPAGPDIGLHDLDIARAGGGLDFEDVLPGSDENAVLNISFAGGLTAPIVKPRTWPKKHRQAFRGKLAGSLGSAREEDDASPGKYNALDDDPIIAPPAYGSWQAADDDVKAAKERWADTKTFDLGWLHTVNGEVTNRAAAGLGARIIARHQEEFSARAWAQLSGAREVSKSLRTARTAMAAGGSLHKRVANLPPVQVLQVTKGVHDIVAVDGKGASTVADRTARVAADVTLSPEFRRMANVGATMSVPVAIRTKDTAPVIAMQATTLAFAGKVQVSSASFKQPNLGVRSEEKGAWEKSAKASGGKAGTVPNKREATIVSASRKAAKPEPAEDVAALKSTAMAKIDPLHTVPQLLRERVEGLPQDTAKDGHIARDFGFSLEFDEATYLRLQQLDPDFLMPGFSTVPDDSVMLTETNQQFVESFLIGMNHEMSREFAWRQFPLRLDQSWFRQFWDYRGSAGKTDITPISDWGMDQKLGAGKGDADQAVVLVKSELFRRYPDTRVYAVRAKWGKPGKDDIPVDPTRAPETRDSAGKRKRVRLPILDDPGSWIAPEFDGKVGTSANFFGFALSPETLIGDKDDPGYFLLFEQGKRDPQFGLDRADGFPKSAPKEANDLQWGHFAASQDDLDAAQYAGANPTWANRSIEGAKWGRNAAETARLCRQKRVRMIIPAHTLVQKPAKLARK